MVMPLQKAGLSVYLVLWLVNLASTALRAMAFVPAISKPSLRHPICTVRSTSGDSMIECRYDVGEHRATLRVRPSFLHRMPPHTLLASKSSSTVGSLLQSKDQPALHRPSHQDESFYTRWMAS